EWMPAVCFLRLQLEKIRDQLEAKLLALLGMKLRAGDVAVGDERRDRAAVIRLGDDDAALFRGEMTRVHEIRVRSAGSRLDTIEQRMRIDDVERVPAHMRNFQ